MYAFFAESCLCAQKANANCINIRFKSLYHEKCTPLHYFSLIVNPVSFGHTLENIFYLSFLVQRGYVKLFLNEDGLPVVVPKPDTNGKTLLQTAYHSEVETENCSSQFIVSLSMDEWEELLDAFQLRNEKPLIPQHRGPG